MGSIKEQFELEDMSNASPLLKKTSSFSNASGKSRNFNCDDSNRILNDTTPGSKLSLKIIPVPTQEKVPETNFRITNFVESERLRQSSSQF